MGGMTVSSHALTANFHVSVPPPSPLGGDGKPAYRKVGVRG